MSNTNDNFHQPLSSDSPDVVTAASTGSENDAASLSTTPTSTKEGKKTIDHRAFPIRRLKWTRENSAASKEEEKMERDIIEAYKALMIEKHGGEPTPTDEESDRQILEYLYSVPDEDLLAPFVDAASSDEVKDATSQLSEVERAAFDKAVREELNKVRIGNLREHAAFCGYCESSIKKPAQDVTAQLGKPTKSDVRAVSANGNAIAAASSSSTPTRTIGQRRSSIVTRGRVMRNTNQIDSTAASNKERVMLDITAASQEKPSRPTLSYEQLEAIRRGIVDRLHDSPATPNSSAASSASPISTVTSNDSSAASSEGESIAEPHGAFDFAALSAALEKTSESNATHGLLLQKICDQYKETLEESRNTWKWMNRLIDAVSSLSDNVITMGRCFEHSSRLTHAALEKMNHFIGNEQEKEDTKGISNNAIVADPSSTAAFKD